jgi:hypothetical protein
MKTKNKPYTRGDWTALPFPKQNRTILYNCRTRRYDIYRGIPNQKDEKQKKPLPIVNMIKLKEDWKRVSMILAGAFLVWGVAFTAIIIAKVL